MKIIYLHQYFTTPEHSGGVRSYEFAKRLVASGHQVDIITSTAFFPTKKQPKEIFVSRRNIDGINVHVIRINYDNKMPFYRRIISFLGFMVIASIYALRFRKSHLIYATSTPLTIGIPALIIKCIFSIPIIFEVRDMWPDVPIAMGLIKNKLIITALHKFEILMYNSSVKIVALSEGMASEIIKKGIEQEKVSIIPNACDIKEFSAAKTISLDKFRDNKDTKICLYAGTFGIVNNLNYLIDIASEIKKEGYNIKIILMGDGMEKNKIIQRIRAKKITNIIFTMSQVSKKELISYIVSVDCCISTVLNIPVLYNNSANKFFDSLAAGRPIIINHEGWQADTIRKNNLGLVLNRDFSESAKNLNFFLHNNTKEVLETEIKKFAADNYSRDLLFDKLEKLMILATQTTRQYF